MNPTKGYYSIVQFCPDLARRETVNISVVLLVPEKDLYEPRMFADRLRRESNLQAVASEEFHAKQGFEPTTIQQDGEIVWEIRANVAQQKLIERGIIDA